MFPYVLKFLRVHYHTHLETYSLSNSTPKVAHFQTTIFGSIYHDRGKLLEGKQERNS